MPAAVQCRDDLYGLLRLQAANCRIPGRLNTFGDAETNRIVTARTSNSDDEMGGWLIHCRFGHYQYRS
jgi:hypothetical protein